MFLMLLLAAASAPPPPGTLTFSGSISPAAARDLVAALAKSDARRLVIDSYGGQEQAALDIAAAIARGKIEVTVKGVCMSACAQYILPAASRVSIQPGSLVAMHISSYSIWKWADGSNARGRADEALKLDSRDVHERTSQLLSGRPTALRLLDLSFVALHPICVARQPGSPARIKTVASLFIPSRAALEQLGYAVPLSWPTSGRAAANYAMPFVKRGTRIAFGAPRQRMDALEAPRPCVSTAR